MTQTPVQKALEHLFAPYFLSHETFHRNLGKEYDRECDRCKMLQDAELYINIVSERKAKELINKEPSTLIGWPEQG